MDGLDSTRAMVQFLGGRDDQQPFALYSVRAASSDDRG